MADGSAAVRSSWRHAWATRQQAQALEIGIEVLMIMQARYTAHNYSSVLNLISGFLFNIRILNLDILVVYSPFSCDRTRILSSGAQLQRDRESVGTAQQISPAARARTG